MVNYKVSVSDEAKLSLRKIYDWLEEKVSITTAEKVRDGLLEAIADLASMPQKHGLVREIQNDTIVYRRVLKWSYKIIFTIEEDLIEVLVVDIVHSKSDLSRLQDLYGD